MGGNFVSSRKTSITPFLTSYYAGRTSGSTGPATRASIDLDALADIVFHLSVSLTAHDLLTAPLALWWEILPSPWGARILICDAKVGRIAERWFSPVSRDDVPSMKSRLATRFIIAAGNRAGVSLPRPEFLEEDKVELLARWAEEKLRKSGKCLIRTAPNRAVRVCVAARDAGIDLSGAFFIGGGEPITDAKLHEVTAVGASIRPTYSSAEAGRIGIACSRPSTPNDTHLVLDAVALITHPRHVPHSDQSVDAFLVTTLHSSNPKILLNVETDDYGVVDSRTCGCLFEEIGYTKHVTEVFSFSKLTGEGVTLVGSDMTRILEEVLPLRFGGSSLDYQLVEEEDQRGRTKMSIIVHPRIELGSEQDVIDAVLEELKQGHRRMESAILERAGTLQVKRIEPLKSGGWKMMPLYKSKEKRRER